MWVYFLKELNDQGWVICFRVLVVGVHLSIFKRVFSKKLWMTPLRIFYWHPAEHKKKKNSNCKAVLETMPRNPPKGEESPLPAGLRDLPWIVDGVVEAFSAHLWNSMNLSKWKYLHLQRWPISFLFYCLTFILAIQSLPKMKTMWLLVFVSSSVLLYWLYSKIILSKYLEKKKKRKLGKEEIGW